MAETKGGIDEALRASPTKRLYEAIFLISQGVAADLGGLIEHVDQILERAGAEVVAMKKWDERRLAYEIQGQKRGIYILAYIHAEPDAVAKVENDCNISERIMRFMVIRADHMTLDEAGAHDDREGLATEAKMRGQRGEDKETRASGVKIGAPQPPKETAEPDSAEQAAGEAAGEAGQEPSGQTGQPRAEQNEQPADRPASERAETNA